MYNYQYPRILEKELRNYKPARKYAKRIALIHRIYGYDIACKCLLLYTKNVSNPCDFLRLVFSHEINYPMIRLLGTEPFDMPIHVFCGADARLNLQETIAFLKSLKHPFAQYAAKYLLDSSR